MILALYIAFASRGDSEYWSAGPPDLLVPPLDCPLAGGEDRLRRTSDQNSGTSVMLAVDIRTPLRGHVLRTPGHYGTGAYADKTKIRPIVLILVRSIPSVGHLARPADLSIPWLGNDPDETPRTVEGERKHPLGILSPKKLDNT